MPFFEYGSLELDYLSKKDKRFAAAIARIGIIEREVEPDLFAALVNSIVGQQISTKAHKTIWNRMKETLHSITPETISSYDLDRLQQFGISFRKAEYIKNAADQVLSGALDIETLRGMDDSAAISELVKLPGIGVWTAEMLLLFSLQRSDILSFGDFAIIRGIKKLYGHKTVDRERFERYRKRFSPYGSVASLYLWAISAEE